MRKFAIRLSVMTALFLAASALLWIVPGNYLHPLSMIINKRDILVSKRPPRIILMGGSNLLTVQSAVIAKETGRDVVNMGIWAGCPVQDVFELIGPDLVSGDTVIVVMEYPVLFVSEYKKSIEKDRFAFLIRPGYYSKKYLEEGRPLDLIRVFYGILQIKIKTYLLHAYKGEWKYAADRGSYKYRGTSNEYGDRIVPTTVLRPLGGERTLFETDGSLSLKHLVKIHDRCIRRGLRMAFCFAPYPRQEFERNRKKIEAVHRFMKEHTRIPLLNSPEDNTYDESFFADTVNHLTREGENVRTKKFASQIRQFLEGSPAR